MKHLLLFTFSFLFVAILSAQKAKTFDEDIQRRLYSRKVDRLSKGLEEKLKSE